MLVRGMQVCLALFFDRTVRCLAFLFVESCIDGLVDSASYGVTCAFDASEG